MIHMHKRAAPMPSRRALCGVELAERNALRFLTTAGRHVSCPRCRALIKAENDAARDHANMLFAEARDMSRYTRKK